MTAKYSSVASGSRNRAGNDPIFLLNGEANARIAAGESILNATMGSLMHDDGTLCTMPTVVDAFAAAQRPGAGYSPIAGLPAYREAVIHDVFGDGPLARKAVAIATPGGSGAVFEAVVNFLEPGQKMLLPSFFWGPYTAISQHTGRGIDPFPMFADDGSFNLAAMAEGLERHMSTQGRALLVLNFPCHNPTGYTLSAEEWNAITEVVAREGARGPVTVLIDVAYMDFGGDAARAWVDAVPGLLEHATVLVAWTASKTMAQYGARVGALVALHDDPDEVEQMNNALGYSARATWSNCNHAGQLAVSRLLTDSDLIPGVAAERGELVKLLQSRIDAFNTEAASADFSTPRYDAGFFVSVFTPDEQVTGARMRELGVYTIPIPGAVRVAMCSTPTHAVPRLIDALQQGVAAAR